MANEIVEYFQLLRILDKLDRLVDEIARMPAKPDLPARHPQAVQAAQRAALAAQKAGLAAQRSVENWTPDDITHEGASHAENTRPRRQPDRG